jgi:hypothetical protein
MLMAFLTNCHEAANSEHFQDNESTEMVIKYDGCK